MKQYGKTHIVGFRPDGSEILSRWPQSKEDAIIEDVCRWEPYPPEWCEACRSNYLIYTKTGIRNCCAINNAGAAYREGFALGDPINATEAIKRGMDYYIVDKHVSTCGHIGKLTLSGKCWLCSRLAAREKSPRQAALAAGAIWYHPAPGDLCRKCGVWARRRVVDGKCGACEVSDTDVVIDPRRVDLIVGADAVISYEEAKAAGFSVYRTGAACRKGHTGWRYVSTRNCLDCR